MKKKMKTTNLRWGSQAIKPQLFHCRWADARLAPNLEPGLCARQEEKHDARLCFGAGPFQPQVSLAVSS
jgi:hypothetical protein